MGYDYQTKKKELFTEAGVREYLLPIRDNARKLLKQAGAFQMDQAYRDITGSNWTMIAAIDYLTEIKELVRVTPRGSVMTQYEVYIRGNLPL